MRKQGWAVLFTVVVTATALGQTTAEGEIAGRITDSDGRFVLGTVKLSRT